MLMFGQVIYSLEITINHFCCIVTVLNFKKKACIVRKQMYITMHSCIRYIINEYKVSYGPKTEPCGTPALIDPQSEYWQLMTLL